MPFTRELLADLFAGVGKDWLELIKITLREETTKALTKLYEKDPAGLCPKPKNVFAFARECPLDSARVVIIAQDPYPNRSQACGLAFSVPIGTQIPGSLRNIAACLGVQPIHGDLTAWARQGVILMNAALTTEQGKSRAHVGIWEELTAGIMRELAARGCIFIALGNDAKDIIALSNVNKAPVLYWGHPSPISAVNQKDNPKNFIHCDCFKRANEILIETNRAPIDWDWTGARASIPDGLWIFTDGGASKNGKKDCRARAAWTSVSMPGRIEAPLFTENIILQPSNQRAELTAIVRGLESITEIQRAGAIYLITDSQYSINCITKWYHDWIRNDKLAGKSHLDLIARAVELSRGVRFQHTRSHVARPNTPLEEFIWIYNDKVDRAAQCVSIL